VVLAVLALTSSTAAWATTVRPTRSDQAMADAAVLRQTDVPPGAWQPMTGGIQSSSNAPCGVPCIVLTGVAQSGFRSETVTFQSFALAFQTRKMLQAGPDDRTPAGIRRAKKWTC
jgi:hypothetical protein